MIINSIEYETSLAYLFISVKSAMIASNHGDKQCSQFYGP